MEKKIGVISNVKFGFGGYQEAMLGLSITFDFKGSGCVSFISGGWNFDPDTHAKWTKEDKIKQQADMCEKIIILMKEAKVDNVMQLKGKPVECTFVNYNELKDWRILTEAIL